MLVSTTLTASGGLSTTQLTATSLTATGLAVGASGLSTTGTR